MMAWKIDQKIRAQAEERRKTFMNSLVVSKRVWDLELMMGSMTCKEVKKVNGVWIVDEKQGGKVGKGLMR